MSKPGDNSGVGLGVEEAVERLPFRVSIASREEMAAVVRLRATAYGRHLPELGARLMQAEPADFEWGCEVIVATSKLDGSVLGSLRTHANALKPLPLEASLALPERFRGKRLIEATRLSVLAGNQASMVRNALFKAFYLYGLAQQVDYLIAAGRRPVDRIYDSLLFSDVAEPAVFYPMAHAGGVPHRVMSLSVDEAEPAWRDAEHLLYPFMCLTRHPDIDLGAARHLSGDWARLRPLPGFANAKGRLFHLPLPQRFSA